MKDSEAQKEPLEISRDSRKRNYIMIFSRIGKLVLGERPSKARKDNVGIE